MFFFGGGAKNLRAEHQFSASFPGKRAEMRRKIIVRPFSRKKGGKLIFRQGGGRRAEGGFYPRPSEHNCDSINLRKFKQRHLETAFQIFSFWDGSFVFQT